MKLPRFDTEKLLTESLKDPKALEEYEKLTIGSEIKKIRRRYRLTQKQIAAALKTSQSVIARIEAGKQNLSLRVLVKVAIVLKKRLEVRFY